MSGYPIELITKYRAGKISRQQFTKQFSDWQKENGLNFDCKGTADKSGIYLHYRGITGTIKNGVIQWGGKITAKSIFIFMRQVDYLQNQRRSYFENMCYWNGIAEKADMINERDAWGNKIPLLHTREELKAAARKNSEYFYKKLQKSESTWN